MINRTFVWTMIALFLFTGMALGGYDLSGSAGAENLSIASSILPSLEADAGTTLAGAEAPQMTATEPGTELAFYTTQAPTKADLKTLLPFNAEVSPSTYFFYRGNYLGWNGFTSQYPSTSPGLWIERSVSWSWYVTMPMGSWAQELLYVPAASPIYMYEVYPGEYVTKYNLGSVQPGYYYIWYYADTPGRHLNIFGSSSGYSNIVTIDVYGIPALKPTPPKPVPPDPKKECEKNPNCHYVDGQCLCTMPNPDNPEREKCEQNSNCDWVNGHCFCRGFEPMPGPVPNPNPEPIPQPAPNPYPGPTQRPNPAEICQQNPGCHWANGQCLCTGMGGDNSGGLLGDNGEEMTI